MDKTTDLSPRPSPSRAWSRFTAAGKVVADGGRPRRRKVTVAAPATGAPDAAACLTAEVTVEIDTEVAAEVVAEVAVEMAAEVAMYAADVEAAAAMARGRDGGGGRGGGGGGGDEG